MVVGFDMLLAYCSNDAHVHFPKKLGFVVSTLMCEILIQWIFLGLPHWKEVKGDAVVSKEMAVEIGEPQEMLKFLNSLV